MGSKLTTSVIPGRASSREPEIQTASPLAPQPGFRVPACGRPRNDAVTNLLRRSPAWRQQDHLVHAQRRGGVGRDRAASQLVGRLRNAFEPVRRTGKLRPGAVRLLHRDRRRPRGVGLPLSRRLADGTSGRDDRDRSTRTAPSTRSRRRSSSNGAFQCGFCTPGFMLMVKQLLDALPRSRRRPHPRLSRREPVPLRRLSGNHPGGEVGRAKTAGRPVRMTICERGVLPCHRPYHRGSAVVSPARPQPVEHPVRVQSRLDVRRLRDLRAGDVGGRRAAATARTFAIRPNPRLCRNPDRADAARLGDRRPDRRRARRLSRPQAHHDARDPGLLGHDRAQRVRLGLGVVCGIALSRRPRHRLGMGHRRVDRFGTVAGQGSRPRRRADAMRVGHRVFPGLVRLAVRRRDGAERHGGTCS